MSSDDARLVRALVACYPPGWRRRYGAEYAQLLCDLRVHRRPALILDSLRGAVRAQGGALMSRNSSLTMVVWAAGLFTVAGIAFAKLAEDFPRGGLYPVVVVAAAVALLALVAAAAPSAVSLLKGRDAGAWKYVAVPVVGTALWFGMLRLARSLAGHGVHSAPNVTGFVLLAVSGVAVVAATAWAAATVLRRVPADQSPGVRTGAVLTVAAGMAVATVAAVIWGLRVPAAASTGEHGFVATPFVPSWIAVVVALAAATTLAALAGRRQLTTIR